MSPAASPVPAYSPLRRYLHWAVAGLILVQFVALDSIGRAFHRSVEAGAQVYDLIAAAHLALGLAVLALAAWRVVLRLRHGAPPASEAEPLPFRRLAHFTHLALFALLFALPLSGLVAWFGLLGPAAGAHEVMTKLLLALVALHVLGALAHRLWWKTDVMARMSLR